MPAETIFLPLLAQVGLSALVWAWMYYTRIREIRRRHIAVQDLAIHEQGKALLSRVALPAENFSNLFEMPVLFYVALLVVYVTQHVDTTYLVLATAFVVLRHAHSLIHVTYNRVMHRFGVYILSSLILWALWVRIGTQIIAGL